MKDAPDLIQMACDGDKPNSFIRMALTIEDAVLAHITFERRRLLESSSDALFDARSTN